MGYFRNEFREEDFIERRRKVFEFIGEDAVAVIQSAEDQPGFSLFRQSNYFYYLCGVQTPNAYLLLRGEDRKAIVYLPKRGRITLDEGAAPGIEDAELILQHFGLDEVAPVERLQEDIGAPRFVYTPFGPSEGRGATRWDYKLAWKKAADDPWNGRASRQEHFIGLLRTRCLRSEVRNLSPTLDVMRCVKSRAEIDVMRRAGYLTGLAVREAMKVTKPGVIESQLAALAEYIYGIHGATGRGYKPIIAGGKNIWYVHYSRLDCPLQDGDMVLMDFSPEVGGYTSDIGRFWPVNGKYSPRQRELYAYVVEYHKTLLRKIRPGIMAGQVMDEAAEEMRPVFEKWEFSKDVYRAAGERLLQFRGHLSHGVGMAVHDVGDYPSRPLEPGVVFAVDPQMWIPEEELYIRAEDTGVVTEEGFEVFTSQAPLDLDDVEKLMAEEAMDLPLMDL